MISKIKLIHKPITILFALIIFIASCSIKTDSIDKSKSFFYNANVIAEKNKLKEINNKLWLSNENKNTAKAQKYQKEFDAAYQKALSELTQLNISSFPINFTQLGSENFFKITGIEMSKYQTSNGEHLLNYTIKINYELQPKFFEMKRIRIEFCDKDNSIIKVHNLITESKTSTSLNLQNSLDLKEFDHIIIY